MTEWILSSSVLILTVILVRRLFQDKLQPHTRYLLWALVLVRLLVPFSVFQSPVSTGGILSLSPIQSVTDSLSKPNISYQEAYDRVSQEATAPNFVPQTPLEEQAQQLVKRSIPAFWLENILLWVWIGGMAVMALCLLLSNLKFRRYLRTHRQLLERHPAGLPVYVCSGLDTPCLFGAVKPAIYLLPGEAEDETRKQHVLTHELTHYCHGDHIWAALRCLCLVLHWYNPFVWKAAILSRRDGELACDEATIRKLGEDQRIAYGVTLIEMTCAKQAGAGLMNTATTMTGSKSAIKERVTMIAKKPKKSIVALIAAVLIAAAAAVICFSTQTKLPTPRSEDAEKIEAFFRLLGSEAKFCNLETKEDGIRYYGSYKNDSGETCHIVFIPSDRADQADIPVKIDIGGQMITSRKPFSLYALSPNEYPTSSITYDLGRFIPIPWDESESRIMDKRLVKKVAQIHREYEKRLYGSILEVSMSENEEDAKTQAEAAFKIYSQGLMDVGFLFSYGQFDGYMVMSYAYGSETMTPSIICGYAFPAGLNQVGLVGYKDGRLYNIEQLYQDNKFSDESLEALTKLHQILYEERK